MIESSEIIHRRSPTAMTFGELYGLAFRRPLVSFNALVVDAGKMKKAFFAVLLSAILYSFVYLFLIFGKGLPYKPWLKIAPEVYYQYNVWFVAPSMFLGCILSASVTHVIVLASGTRGNFENLLACFAFSVSVASWSTLVHDLVTSFLGAIHVIDQRHYEHLLNTATIWRTVLWLLMTLYLVWFIMLFSSSIRSCYRIKRRTSFLLAIAAFVVYQGFFLIFNR
jgi:hypothetical protein